MDSNLFRYIWNHSQRDQILIGLIVIASIPTYFLALSMPKYIVNGPISQTSHTYAEGPFQTLVITTPGIDWLGVPSITVFDGVALGQFHHLAFLCAGLFALVCVNGGFKFFINTFKGQLGERMLRRLRYELVDRALRFPQSHLKRVKPAEMATMVNNEVEPLGGFIGDAFATPMFLLAQAFTAMAFLLLQSVPLGLVAFGVVVLQTGIIPRLRRRLIVLAKARQLAARQFAGRVGEIVESAREIRLNDATNWERADVSDRLGEIYFIRYRFFRTKFFIKFLNNMMSQITPLLFYFVGGYFAIQGTLDIGQLVAAIAVYRELPGPIKELIDWDQQRVDVQVKYATITEQFSPDNLAQPSMTALSNDPPPRLEGPLILRDVALGDDDNEALLDRLNFSQDPGGRVAILSDNPRASEMLSDALTRLVPPLRGEIAVGERDVPNLADNIGGKRIAYVGAGTYFANASVRDTLLYGLRRPPAVDANPKADDDFDIYEAQRSGNLPLSPRGNWLDTDLAGVPAGTDLDAHLLQALRRVALFDEVFEFGLSTRIDPETQPDLALKVTQARAVLRFWIEEDVHADLVEPFDENAYTTEDSIAANLLFGATRTQGLREDVLVGAAGTKALAAHDLTDALRTLGARVAEMLVELIEAAGPEASLLRDIDLLAPGEAETMAELGPDVGRWPVGTETGDLLLRLALRYVEPRDRLGLLDDTLRRRILAARAHLADELAVPLDGAFDRYEIDDYTPGATILDNILFGKVRYEAAEGTTRVRQIILELLSELDMNDDIAVAGMARPVGNGGRNLTEAQRQQLALARALLKRPDILVLNRALDALGPQDENALMRTVLDTADEWGVAETTILAAVSRPEIAALFARKVTLQNGAMTENPT